MRRSVFAPLLICISVGSTLTFGQGSSNQLSSPVPGTPKRQTAAPRPATGQEQVIAYWTTETGWTSELQLRNNDPNRDLIVTPVVRSPNGVEASLLPITVKPQEVKSVDLDSAMIDAGAPQFRGTYGSVALRYSSAYLPTMYAALMVRRTGHAVAFHIDAKGQSQKLQLGSREGIWWLPKDTVSDFLILLNQGNSVVPLDVSLYDAAGRESKQKILLGPREMSRFSIRKLLQTAGLTGSYGGVKIATSANAGSLDTLHFLFDETAGFSDILKMFDYDTNAKLEERDYARTGIWTLRAPMLALTNPDPALAFPLGTKLQPQIFIRNTTAKPIDAALRFNWRNSGTTGKAAGPKLKLLPYETRLVDVAALQNAAVLPKEANWTSVTLTTNSLPDEVVAVAASYDAILKHGAQTPFSDQLTFKWEGGMWEYDPYHNSIITAGNGGTEPTQAAFTIFYNQGTQKYEVEQTLQPDEQMWINVGKLIREQVPDKNGERLPADLTSGSYEFRDISHQGRSALFEGKVIYDKTYGHVAYGCAACCGYDTLNTFLEYDPLTIANGQQSQQYVLTYDECQGGALADVSDSFYNHWSTGNTSIVTANTYGLHTAFAPGSTTSQTSGCLNNNDSLRNCPLKCVTPQGPDYVASLSCTPSSLTRGGSVTCTVSNAPTGTTFSAWQFKDSSNNPVKGSGNTNSWTGVVVTSGTVSVTVTPSGGNAQTPSANVTVTNRNWHTGPATPPAPVVNGTFYTLPVPPQNTGYDSGLGYFKWHYVLNSGSQGLQYSTINDNGPNQGYTYWPSNQIFSTWDFQYEINPDLENTSSTFYQKNCGSSGFISGSNLLAQTNRHEWNSSAQSHYAFYSNSLNSSDNNPGDFLEHQIAAPGANLSTFAQDSTSGINNRLSTVTSDSQVEPYPVNYSAANVFLGNINYAPYAPCP